MSAVVMVVRFVTICFTLVLESTLSTEDERRTSCVIVGKVGIYAQESWSMQEDGDGTKLL